MLHLNKTSSFLNAFSLKKSRNIAAGTLLLFVCSQIAFPFIPVPMTMQTFALKVIALCLSPWQSFLAVQCWLTLGVMGCPVFANLSSHPGAFFGPTGGYLWGFLVATPIMSALFMRWGTSFFRLFLIASFGGGLILAMGWAQLAFLLGSGIKAWHLGGLPFILGDVVKSIMALWLVYGILKGSYQR